MPTMPPEPKPVRCESLRRDEDEREGDRRRAVTTSQRLHRDETSALLFFFDRLRRLLGLIARLLHLALLDHLVQLLLVRVHLEIGADLRQRDRLAISSCRYHFVECEYQVKALLRYLLFCEIICTTSYIGNNLHIYVTSS